MSLFLHSIALITLLCAVVARPGVAAESLPAVLEPYAGYDVVFGPGGPRVLGPQAAGPIEKMISNPGRVLGQSGCELGDISVQRDAVAVQFTCAGTKLSVRLGDVQRHSGPADARTGVFALVWDAAAVAACTGPCATALAATKDELLRRVRTGESAVPWLRVRPAPGSANGAVVASLLDAQAALAIGDRTAARKHLTSARGSEPEAGWTAAQCFDFALLCHEAGLADDAQWGRACAERLRTAKLAPDDPLALDPATAAGLQPALLALAGEVTAAANHAQTCATKADCDPLPAVRALAAVRAFALAAQVLDRGPLAKPETASHDLLKLRFGMASALGDAEGEIATAKKIQAAKPDAPEAVDLLAAGYARAGQWRQAIELLHDLSKGHPERDIVLGRIAGMINFLTDAAGANPERKADLDAIEARMRASAADPTDIVARFIVATRAYYAGRLPEALPQLEALNQSSNRDPRLPLYLAMAHFWLGHQAEAQRIIQRAVEIGPSDPDVFYCRSQIVRRVNLPLAIADLERYQTMTHQPWAIGPAQKAARVQAELAFLRRGVIPPDWDKPGPERVVFMPESQTGTVVPDDVRLGRNWLPGAVTPSGDPTPDSAGQATAEAATGAQALNPQQQPPGRQQDDPAPWWPVAALTAVAAAVAARIWARKQP